MRSSSFKPSWLKPHRKPLDSSTQQAEPLQEKKYRSKGKRHQDHRVKFLFVVHIRSPDTPPTAWIIATLCVRNFSEIGATQTHVNNPRKPPPPSHLKIRCLKPHPPIVSSWMGRASRFPTLPARLREIVRSTPRRVFGSRPGSSTSGFPPRPPVAERKIVRSTQTRQGRR